MNTRPKLRSLLHERISNSLVFQLEIRTYLSVITPVNYDSLGTLFQKKGV